MHLDVEPRPSSTTAPLPRPLVHFSPIVVDRLLDRLSTDDAYRLLFQSDPHQALAQIGFNPADGEGWPDCFFGIALASKQAIAQARTEIQFMLLRGLDQTVPNLNAGTQRAEYVRKQ